MRDLRVPKVAAAAVLVLAATSCSLIGSDESSDAGRDGSGETTAEDTTVILLTHSDFSLPKKVIRGFEQESGYSLEVRPSDGVGTLVNLVTDEAGKPSGDAVFGVDNTFASRVEDAGALSPYDGDLPPGAETFALPGDDGQRLVPVDTGNVCVNVDDTWFAENDLAPPQTLDDLADPAYEGLFVTSSAATSSPGLAFLLTTIAAYGDDWPDYWQRLLDNDVEIAPSWSEAYYGGFTQGEGDRPIVLSYDSSPAFTVDEKSETSSTSALLDTCYRQVEYAGVLEGTENPVGARELVSYLLGEQVQSALPESMYVFPVVDGVDLPPDWSRFAQQPSEPYAVDPAEIEANREDWLVEWNDLVSR
ncbi:thiamine ABC transporter substrate-binding protein [Nocardioides marinquilinus]|uniref:Thiamine ABC transporter substrate-binding protein n=1 Tax=Nocardioides marinquilinus TaxID=1210400 RepID=A0ABP9PJX8_9ACTN